jgi:hypothetical protein
LGSARARGVIRVACARPGGSGRAHFPQPLRGGGPPMGRGSPS